MPFQIILRRQADLNIFERAKQIRHAHDGENRKVEASVCNRHGLIGTNLRYSFYRHSSSALRGPSVHDPPTELKKQYRRRTAKTDGLVSESG
jgi:hypothetical protein